MSFNDIKSQEQAITLLKISIQSGRLSGGYLFTGPEGVGKKLAAKTLAKALNCVSASLDACDDCASCRKIESNQHPDIHILENNGGEIKIEFIRQLQSQINLRPYEGKAKVFIIDNAHQLNAESSGALLKVLEEPPKNSLIILITDKPGRLYKTIVSRCKTVKFTALPGSSLKAFFQKEHALTGENAQFLAYFSEGRLGRALKLKDADILGLKNRVIDDFAFSRKTGAENLPIKEKEDVRLYMNILAAWFRDIYLAKAGLPHAQLINIDRKDDILRQAGRFTFLDLNAILDTISQTLFGLERNINTRLLLHNLGAQICKD